MFSKRLFILFLIAFLNQEFLIEADQHLSSHLMKNRVSNITFHLMKKRKRKARDNEIKSNFQLPRTTEIISNSTQKVQNTNFVMQNNENKNEFSSTRKNLLNLPKSKIRVKREKFEKNLNSKLQASYLEDLAASFPKSEHELEEERLASITADKVEDDKVFKRSFAENGKGLYQSCHIKVNRNLQNPKSDEYSRIYKINFDPNDELQKRRYNKIEQPQVFSIEDDSNDYFNNKETHLRNSNPDDFQNRNREMVKKCASKHEKCSKL